jgi:hypothetical protein
MRNFCVTILFLSLSVCTDAQQLGQVTFSGGSSLSYFSFRTDQGLLIRVSVDGKILEWGTEVKALRGDYYAPGLQPFMGRIEYYSAESDSAFRGKVKSVGTCSFTYYYSYDSDSKPGKIKSIGTVSFDYYTNFDDKSRQGKIRFAGNQVLEYYSSFDEEILRGKVKAIGSTAITYYSIFDDKLVRGKIKSIGSFNYSWYNSFDRSDYRGALKAGSYRQDIGRVTYILSL